MSATTEHASQGIQILTIPNVKATQDYDNEQVELASGELQVLLVSIELEQSAYTSASSEKQQQQQLDYATDLWLVLAVGSDFSVPVPANQIIKPHRAQSVNSYILPSQEVSGASVKLTLPAGTDADKVARFQQILSQYSAYQDDDRSDAGAIELMDEDGHVVGVLQGNFNVRETDSLSDAGNEKTPVLIDLPPEPESVSEKQDLNVDVLTEDEQKDWMIRGANTISQIIIKSSQFIGGKIQGAADSYVANNPAAGPPGARTPTGEKADALAAQPGREPIKVGPKTQSSVRTLHQWSGTAVQVSAKTTGAILEVAGHIGDKIGRKTGIQRQVKPDGTYGPPPKGIRGFINRSLIAANTVLDGVDAGAQTLLYTGGDAASKVVGHKYGEDARQVADGVGRTGKNVFIVYKDIRGVRRSALLKAARSRVLKAKLDDGREVTVKIDEKGNAIAAPTEPTGSGTSTPGRTGSTAAASSSTNTTAAAQARAPAPAKSFTPLTEKRFIAGDPLPSSASSSTSPSNSAGYATPPSYSESDGRTHGLPPPPTHHSIRRTPSPKPKN
ncbi:hypothetical protein BCV70DRAFT_198793 [Testicularia cyperi]|uniref:Senescence domain-containing protein n=1 Tax=Testicularia cyperi TaxID=1882483 RepID=A0A317XSM5_9BASI|nr:hypothetical protein BCV70DRAFT_198793 [Testicularia cyperi]